MSVRPSRAETSQLSLRAASSRRSWFGFLKLRHVLGERIVVRPVLAEVGFDGAVEHQRAVLVAQWLDMAVGKKDRPDASRAEAAGEARPHRSRPPTTGQDPRPLAALISPIHQ